MEARAAVVKSGLAEVMLGLVAACPGRVANWVAAACMALVALLLLAHPGQAAISAAAACPALAATLSLVDPGQEAN